MIEIKLIIQPCIEDLHKSYSKYGLGDQFRGDELDDTFTGHEVSEKCI
jgi:hypothetical protein